MKIGIDIRNIGKKRTGDEVVFFNLVKNLAQIDTQNEYLLFTDILDKAVLQEISINLGIENKSNFTIIPLFAKNKFDWNFSVLSKYLKKNPIDIYHTQYILPFFIPKNIKLITTIHDVSFLAYPEHIKFMDLVFLKILIPWSLKRASKIIAVSEFTKSEIIKYYQIDSEKIEVAQNAVGENFLKSLVESESPFAQNIQSKYSLPKDFILYIGTLQPRKNLPFLVEAFAKIKKEIGETKLVLCGNRNAHNFDPKIALKIKEFSLEKEVFFPGFVEENDKPAIFKLAKAFCYPSLYEGFGIPILEAFASNTPVITSDILPHQEVAQNCALFFNPTNIEELSQEIKLILTDEKIRNNLIEKGKQKLDTFSWKKNAQKVLETYQKMV